MQAVHVARGKASRNRAILGCWKLDARLTASAPAARAQEGGLGRSGGTASRPGPSQWPPAWPFFYSVPSPKC